MKIAFLQYGIKLMCLNTIKSRFISEFRKKAT